MNTLSNGKQCISHDAIDGFWPVSWSEGVAEDVEQNFILTC
jgi:hypothetical protein